MENQSTSTHPMILVAAASVTLLSLTGVAALLVGALGSHTLNVGLYGDRLRADQLGEPLR